MTNATREDVAAYIDLLRTKYAGKASEADLKAYEEKLLSQYNIQVEENPSFLEKAVDLGLRGLDYAGGLTRTALADAIGEDKTVTGDDWVNALKGKALSSNEILEKEGVPAGGSLSQILPSLYSDTGNEWLKFQRGGPFDATPRGAVGLGLDIITDPLTYLTFGASAGSKTAKALQPVGSAIKKTGEKIYKSGLKPFDAVTEDMAKTSASEVMTKYGIGGTTKQIEKQVGNVAKELLEKKNQLLQYADKSGATINMRDATYDVRKNLLDVKKGIDPIYKKRTRGVKEEVSEYRKLGELTPSQVDELKASLYRDINDNAFNPLKKNTIKDDFRKSTAKGLKESIEETLSKLEPGLGDELKNTNDELSTMLTIKDALRKEVKKADKKNIVSSVDGGLAGVALKDPLLGVGLLTGKKLSDLSKTTLFRTMSGKGLKSVGEAPPLIDVLARRGAIEKNKE